MTQTQAETAVRLISLAVSTGHRNTSWSSLRGGMGWWADGADGVVAGGGR